MGLTLKEQKNSKYEVVNPEDDIYNDTFDVVDGVDNNSDVYIRRLPQVFSDDKLSWMDVLQLILPIDGLALNSKILETQYKLVRATCGKKAVDISQPICYNHFSRDVPLVAFDNEEAFGVHNDRENGLAGTLVAKKASKPEDGHIRHTLLILSDHHVAEDANEGKEDEDEAYVNAVI